MKIARRCFLTSYAVFFFPQFSTLITLPPSRWTMPRMRSTILSTRSSARSGRMRKIVSYSRSIVPGACCGVPPVVCVSICCITSPPTLSGTPSNDVPKTNPPKHSREHHPMASSSLTLRFLPQAPVVPVRRHQRSFQERRHGRVGRERDQLPQLLLLRRGEPCQHPVRPFPLLRGSSDPEPHPHRISRAQVLPDAAQSVVPRVAAALLHLDPSELQVDLVVHHHDLVHRDLPEPRRLPH